ncbi:AAEL013365-PA [Aedes aegypti]|uniref:Lipase n=1 Tax=Aedes aegypti TaxID=7159 RepID=Q16JE0_AEDAE|nr:AAEL013365-PA [Aedes aegypti]
MTVYYLRCWLVMTLLKLTSSINPDALLKTSIAQHDYPVELHKVPTEDGFILTATRIPKPGHTPLLIMHGLFGCSVDYTAQGPGKALALLAHDAGFDVWMGNNRGTTYSKKHEHLDEKSQAYWHFSFHELGLYDLSALVDYVLKVTNQKKLHYIGHSQGSTQFLVLTTLRPEYNDVFISTHLSAPVAYIHHATNPAVILTKRADELEAASRLTGIYELGGRGAGSYVDAIIRANQLGFIPLDLILLNLWYVMGYHDSINRTMLPDLLKYSPAGGSIYQVLHYIQLFNARNFQQYDFGSEENLKRYGTAQPPSYPLHKITAPTYIYYGESDNLNQPADLDALAERLPNLQLKFKVPVRRWNHVDFLYGNGAHRLYRMILAKMLDS